MKVWKFYATVIVLFSFCPFWSFSQDTLPDFTVEHKGNGRVVVSWVNPYPNLIQLAVQRSYDSIKRFGSVYSTTSPELPVNGFSDKIPEGVRVYYRIFYVMEGGAYFFTKSKQPSVSESLDVTRVDYRREQLNEDLQKIAEAKNRKELEKEVEDPNKPLFIKENDSSDYKIILLKDFRAYRDSIINQTKDTLAQISNDTLYIRMYDPPFAEKASQYVFTNKDGYIVIKLDDAEKKNYQVTILEEDETPFIDIRKVKEPMLILDKSNFYKGGWYKFTLKENGRVKEKGKVFLPKD
ncbi:MAG: hypothetical protein MUE99_06990 [Chitinophagaceae bacterium]|jgi:hypothetical protein|nr:hypothetical protein [Chitinophagaceae bacterium]